jgi:hypothetical protein
MSANLDLWKIFQQFSDLKDAQAKQSLLEHHLDPDGLNRAIH